MSHTPGPWRVEGVEVLGPSGESVVWELGNNAPRNACLIAAAPELLAALKHFRDAVRDHPALQGRAYVDLGIEVNAAIQKAEGR